MTQKKRDVRAKRRCDASFKPVGGGGGGGNREGANPRTNHGIRSLSLR